MQLPPLGSVEIGQHRPLKLIALSSEFTKEGTPWRRECDPMAPAVGRIKSSLDQTAIFEQIDNTHSVSRIDADDRGKVLLRCHVDLGKRHEHPLVRRPEAMFA